MKRNSCAKALANWRRFISTKSKRLGFLTSWSLWSNSAKTLHMALSATPTLMRAFWSFAA